MREKLNDYKSATIKKMSRLITFTSLHRLIIVFVIVGLALSFALLRTRSFLNPERNEARYNDEKLKINYKSVDYEIVNKLKETQQDSSVTVEKNLQQGRTDPFTEN